jgi:hypothetical protein
VHFNESKRRLTFLFDNMRYRDIMVNFTFFLRHEGFIIMIIIFSILMTDVSTAGPLM